MRAIFLSLFWTMCAVCFIPVIAQEALVVSGFVVDHDTQVPIAGAAVRVKQNTIGSMTNSAGLFSIRVEEHDRLLIISAIGYDTVRFPLEKRTDPVQISLKRFSLNIEEVVISTGYEEVAKNKTTGAVDYIGEELINRSASIDILSRLESLSPGLYFDKETVASSFSLVGRPAAHNLFLQGVSTLRGTSLSGNFPLVILDNFPYDGDINNINPADVESVTLLRDAAAAAIWGAQAGNGVIVITTKRTKHTDRLKMDFSSNLQVYDKPDLYAKQLVKNTDLIDFEIDLYKRGYFNSLYNARTKLALPPVVELLFQEEDRQIDIDKYRTQDVRDDMLRYMFRHAAAQQHHLSFSGGSNKYLFGVSAGYSKSWATRRSDENQRITFKMDNKIQLSENLGLNIGVRWNKGSSIESEGTEYYTDAGYKFPYFRLADSEGNTLSIPKDYREDYLAMVDDKLLDWFYRPLDEIRMPPHSRSQSELIGDLGLTYSLFNSLRASLDYRYTLNDINAETQRSVDSYHIRNLINRGSEIRNGDVFYHFPYGGMYSISSSRTVGHYGRMQLNFDKKFGSHHIRAIGGLDIVSNTSIATGLKMFGYQADRGVFDNTFDPTARYPIYDNLASSGTFENIVSPFKHLVNRSLSLYINGTYTFRDLHSVSASMRRDASNVFGLSTNDKWTPLWSMGYAFHVDKAGFYNLDWLPGLKIRTTYGVSGNVDNSKSSLVTISYVANPLSWGISAPSSSITQLPNPDLRWEKVKQLNLGVDFAFGNFRRVSGSLDYYIKKTDDLLYHVPINPTLGRTLATMNVANTRTKGLNVTISSKNIEGKLMWNSHLNFGYNNSWIVNTYTRYSGPTRYVTSGAISEEPETMVFGMYSYRWGGLHPETGQPRGIIDGEPTSNYGTIMSAQTTLDDLRFHGSARPLYFGAFRNDFRYHKFGVSVNMTYEFDYYFRRAGLNYSSAVNLGQIHGDYYDRWQQPGDENSTHVPSFVYPVSSAANTFYNSTEVLVERGDHIRLRDIRLDYWDKINAKRATIQINCFAMVNNVGVLWKKTKQNLDPLYRGNIPPSLLTTFGFKLTY